MPNKKVEETYICNECGDIFIPVDSKKFCDKCYHRLVIMMDNGEKNDD